MCSDIFCPVKKECVDQGDGWEKKPETFVCNGAFKLAEYQIGSHILMVKNDAYYEADKVKLPGIRAIMVNDENTSLQGYKAGEIHCTEIIPAEEVPSLVAEDPNLIVSPICYFAISFCKAKIGYDDALDAFGCHAVGGIVGGICTGIFCVPELSWTDFGGLIYTGDASLLGSQILGILITIVFVGVLDVVIGLIVKACFKGSLRVSEEEEAQGLDVAAHGESAYPAYIGLD